MTTNIHRYISINLSIPLVVAALFAGPAQAAVLTHENIAIMSSAGAGGSGASTSDMIFNQYSSDGWGWAGGAGGIQGALAITNSGSYAVPANETFKFNVGARVDALNATYGAGNWTIANPTLSFVSSYSAQNNSRFGRGAGSFDIYWVGNDAWAQSKGTPYDRQLNPVYATSAPALSAWAGSAALLGSAYFSSQGSGYANLSYSLASNSLFVNDLLTASAGGSNTATSLYLMATSDTLGMIIFTGGQGQALPTLSFDVVDAPSVSAHVSPVPIPAAGWLFLSAGLSLLGIRPKYRHIANQET